MFKKGCKFTEEHCKNLSLSHKGLIPWNKNKHLSKKQCKNISEGRKILKKKQGYLNSTETRKKMSESRSGEKHYNWQNGKSFEIYPQEFSKPLKERIRQRDGHRCQECFRHESELRTKSNKPCKLSIHHIDYNKKNNKECNLISLCRPCHAQTNYKRIDWVKYFSNNERQ